MTMRLLLCCLLPLGLLASQTAIGANFRSFVFGIGEAVALIR